MTKNEALRQCAKFWRYIADNDIRLSGKEDACRVVLGYVPANACPACEYAAEQRRPHQYFCDSCPVDKWADGSRCSNAEYHEWLYASTPEDRRAAALAIVSLAEESMEPEVGAHEEESE